MTNGTPMLYVSHIGPVKLFSHWSSEACRDVALDPKFIFFSLFSVTGNKVYLEIISKENFGRKQLEEYNKHTIVSIGLP